MIVENNWTHNVSQVAILDNSLNLFEPGGGQNFPTLSKCIVATNRHIVVNCSFVTFDLI